MPSSSTPPIKDAKTVRSALLYDAHHLRIEQIPQPKLLQDHILIAPKFCGICGSDLHFYHHPELAASLKQPHSLTGAALPVPFGHEFSGVVVEVGEGVDAGDLKVGDNVAVMPTITDGSCPSCVAGATNTCSQMAFLGINGQSGGMSELAVVPRELVFGLPDGVGCDAGALIEPLAVAWHGISLAENITPSTTCLILGAGPVGCAVLLCLLAKGATSIAVSEPSFDKRDFVARLGATHMYDPLSGDPATAAKKDLNRPDGVDIVFDCAGVGPTLNTAIAAIKPRGTIVNLAVPTAPSSIGLFPMIMKEAALRCSIAYTRRDFEAVLEAVGQGRLDAKALITKKVRLEDVVEEGLEALHRKDNAECKILVDMSL